MKVLFLIRSLEAGGAEHQLVLTAKGLAERGHAVIVLAFYERGFYAPELKQSKVRLLSMNKQGRWDFPGFYLRLIRQLRKEPVDVIYSFLDSANLFSILCKPFIGNTKIIWSIRASNMDLAVYPWVSRWGYKAECLLSRFTDKIIANSYAGLDYAVVHGFPKAKISVIHNGIDTVKFIPKLITGNILRNKWGVESRSQPLIGLVARIDPMKGHEIFLQAAALLKAKIPNIRFVCVGDGDMDFKHKMRTLATALDLNDVLIWAARHTDMLAVYNALDLLVSSSCFGEGFSNVIAEAMACDVPCVVTDVGDSALIIGGTGQLVVTNDASLLADAILAQLAVKADKGFYRDRITSLYALEQALDKTEVAIRACVTV